VENLTHSLLGAAIAQAALDDDARAPARPTMVAAGVLAGNAPDLDLLYTWVTPAPIGYLLHHRGHTHTVAGVVALGAAMALICLAFPSVRRGAAGFRARLAIVIGAGVLSHLLLDAGNSYGVHPFYPLDMRWYYGDSLFIFEPLLWLLLGGTLAMNAGSRRGGRLLLAFASGLSIATALFAVVPWPALVSIAAIAAACGWWSRRLRPAGRARASIVAVAAFGAIMFGMSGAARSETMRMLPPAPGSSRLDVALSPSPAFPLCWSLIAIDLDESAGVLRLRRASISLAPALWPAGACPLQRLAGGDADGTGSAALSVTDDVRVALDRLRAGAESDCRVRAWLRFVRAPVITPARAYDLRFERPGGGNFTSMTIGTSSPSEACPGFVPEWTMPRADALGGR
jgi:inner membrane protein